MATTIPPSRTQLVRRGQRLEYFTIGYNSLEGLISIVAGAIAGSVSLVGFGLDSIIEVTVKYDERPLGKLSGLPGMPQFKGT